MRGYTLLLCIIRHEIYPVKQRRIKVILAVYFWQSKWSLEISVFASTILTFRNLSLLTMWSEWNSWNDWLASFHAWHYLCLIQSTITAYRWFSTKYLKLLIIPPFPDVNPYPTFCCDLRNLKHSVTSKTSVHERRVHFNMMMTSCLK